MERSNSFRPNTALSSDNIEHENDVSEMRLDTKSGTEAARNQNTRALVKPAGSSLRGAKGDVAIQDSMDCFSAKALRNDENSRLRKKSILHDAQSPQRSAVSAIDRRKATNLYMMSDRTILV
jgi:hypothetical protein